jgi:hypothetical protein
VAQHSSGGAIQRDHAGAWTKAARAREGWIPVALPPPAPLGPLFSTGVLREKIPVSAALVRRTSEPRRCAQRRATILCGSFSLRLGTLRNQYGSLRACSGSQICRHFGRRLESISVVRFRITTGSAVSAFEPVNDAARSNGRTISARDSAL